MNVQKEFQTNTKNVSEQCLQTIFLSVMCDERFLRTLTSWTTSFVRTYDAPWQSVQLSSTCYVRVLM
jgi:hypothetical protein